MTHNNHDHLRRLYRRHYERPGWKWPYYYQQPEPGSGTVSAGAHDTEPPEGFALAFDAFDLRIASTVDEFYERLMQGGEGLERGVGEPGTDSRAEDSQGR